MKIIRKATLAEEKFDIMSNMLFPPQYLPDNLSEKRNLDTKNQRKALEERCAKTSALQEKNEADRWAYVTDLYIERIKQQVDKIPALHQNLSDDEDAIGLTGKINLHPRKINSDINSPLIIWPEDLIKILQRAPATVRTDAIRRSDYGQAAGSILRYIYHLAFLKREPSLTQSRKLFIENYPSKYRPGRPKKDEERISSTYTDTILKKVWKEYSSVAHYWAAFLVLHTDNVILTDTPLRDIDLDDFSRIAAHFAEFGAFCKNKHSPDKHLFSVDQLVLNGLQTPRSKPKIHIDLINKKIEEEIINMKK